MQMYRLNCQAIHRNMHGIHPQLVRRSTTVDGKGKNFCCVIHDWMLRLVFPWISSTPPADFYAMGIQKKVGFTMTITMTSFPSTVPKGKAIAEGNSRQWTPGRCYRKWGSAAVRYIKHVLRQFSICQSYHTLTYIKLESYGSTWWFFCLSKP